MQQAIFDYHAARFAEFPAQPTPLFTQEDAVYRAALVACSQLGFIAHDAECLARAWAAQTKRLGTFDAAHWPDEAQDFGLQARPHVRPFAACPHQLGLYAVLPDAAWVGRMAHAGVPTVQLRFKSDDRVADTKAISHEVRAAVQAVQGTGTRLFINDHWREAITAGAYGVHLGQEDLDALTQDEVETLRASGLRLGISTHGYAEMLRADAVRPSYVALGAVFPTTLKKMATVPQGLARLHDYARLLRDYPLVAIGGIGLEQLPQVLAVGVGSVAVVRAIVGAGNPEKIVQHWLQTLPVVASAWA